MTISTSASTELQTLPPPRSASFAPPPIYPPPRTSNTVRADRNALPPPVPSSIPRRTSTIAKVYLCCSISNIIKLTVTSIAGFLTLISAWWTLDLAMFQATASFQQNCLQILQVLNETAPECKEALSKPLMKPPTWRSYFPKAKEVFVKRLHLRSEMRNHYCFGPNRPSSRFSSTAATCTPVHRRAIRRGRLAEDTPDATSLEGIEEEPMTYYCRRGDQRKQQYEGTAIEEQEQEPDASLSEPTSSCITSSDPCHNDWHDCLASQEGVRKQSDAAIMYGGTDDYGFLQKHRLNERVREGERHQQSKDVFGGGLLAWRVDTDDPYAGWWSILFPDDPLVVEERTQWRPIDRWQEGVNWYDLGLGSHTRNSSLQSTWITYPLHRNTFCLERVDIADLEHQAGSKGGCGTLGNPRTFLVINACLVAILAHQILQRKLGLGRGWTGWNLF